MTIISVSRNKIIEAIRHEPVESLKGGAWVDERRGSKVKDKNCSVCAVGAVMRKVLDPKQSVVKIRKAAMEALGNGEPTGDHYSEIEEGRYMAALSCFFEESFEENMRKMTEELQEHFNDTYLRDPVDHFRKMYNKAVNQTRKDTIDFVKTNFPKEIKIDIDGAKPAKDVKVCST